MTSWGSHVRLFYDYSIPSSLFVVKSSFLPLVGSKRRGLFACYEHLLMSLFPCHLNMRTQEFEVILGSGLLWNSQRASAIRTRTCRSKLKCKRQRADRQVSGPLGQMKTTYVNIDRSERTQSCSQSLLDIWKTYINITRSGWTQSAETLRDLL